MKCLKKKFIIGLPCIAVIVLIFSFKLWCSKGMYGLPKGVCLSQIDSKDHIKVIKIYKCNSELYGNAVRVEVYNKKNDIARNILWDMNAKSVYAKWDNNNIVNINGKKMCIDSSYYFGSE